MRDITQGALHFAMQITGCRDEAGDIVQTAVMKSLEHRNAPHIDDAGFRPWFYRVVHNQAIDWLRSRRKFSPLDQVPEEVSESGNPERQMDADRRKLLLHKALGQLDGLQREIICLKDFHDFSYDDIAEILAIEKGTVMSRLHRARMALRDVLADLNVFPGDRHE